jgi:hypothetical protein
LQVGVAAIGFQCVGHSIPSQVGSVVVVVLVVVVAMVVVVGSGHGGGTARHEVASVAPASVLNPTTIRLPN